MRDEYDFVSGVRGKYAERYATGRNVVVLDPDVAEALSDSTSVNDAVRAMADIANKQARNLPEASRRTG